MILITHLRHKCIGCNSCVESAPDLWIMSNKDGKSYLRKSDKKGKYYTLKTSILEYDTNKEAADNCPVNIISVKIL